MMKLARGNRPFVQINAWAEVSSLRCVRGRPKTRYPAVTFGQFIMLVNIRPLRLFYWVSFSTNVTCPVFALYSPRFCGPLLGPTDFHR